MLSMVVFLLRFKMTDNRFLLTDLVLKTVQAGLIVLPMLVIPLW